MKQRKKKFKSFLPTNRILPTQPPQEANLVTQNENLISNDDEKINKIYVFVKKLFPDKTIEIAIKP